MHRGDKPAFWPAALCAVQAFSPAAKTLAEGQFTCPEHLQYRRVERPTGAEPKKKDMTYGHVFLFGGDKRDRTADLLNAIQALSQLSYTPKYLTRLAVLPQRKIYITRHCGICQQKN